MRVISSIDGTALYELLCSFTKDKLTRQTTEELVKVHVRSTITDRVIGGVCLPYITVYIRQGEKKYYPCELQDVPFRWIDTLVNQTLFIKGFL